jgi:hypothetical protein
MGVQHGDLETLEFIIQSMLEFTVGHGRTFRLADRAPVREIPGETAKRRRKNPERCRPEQQSPIARFRSRANAVTESREQIRLHLRRGFAGGETSRISARNSNASGDGQSASINPGQ